MAQLPPVVISALQSSELNSAFVGSVFVHVEGSQTFRPSPAAGASVYPASQSEQSSLPFVSQSVPSLPLATVAKPLGHVQVLLLQV
jgi:hypothetical protein